MMDDLTLYDISNIDSLGNTVILGADFLGRAVQQFSLNGDNISEIEIAQEVLSEGPLHEITSVRWGVGPNFDENSIYVTEGGGLRGSVESRRVFQVKMK